MVPGGGVALSAGFYAAFVKDESKKSTSTAFKPEQFVLFSGFCIFFCLAEDNAREMSVTKN